ncbi:MAG: hypothetical protein AAF914_05725 [Pseudomonadota bacterium]
MSAARPEGSRQGLALLAWLIGLILAAFVVMAGDALQGADGPGEAIVALVTAPLAALPTLPFTIGFGAIFTLPIFALAAVLAVYFEPLVLRRGYWIALISAALAFVIDPVISALVRDNQWARSHSFGERVWELLFAGQNLVFAIPIGAAVAFYTWRLKRWYG